MDLRDMSFTMSGKGGSDYVVHELCANETKKQVSTFTFVLRVIGWKKKITKGFHGKWKTGSRGNVFRISEHKGFACRGWEI